MKTVQNILAATNPTSLVLGNNSVKAIYGKKQVQVTYNYANDLFSVWAFTLTGIKFSKEVKVDNVYIDSIEQLVKDYILG